MNTFDRLARMLTRRLEKARRLAPGVRADLCDDVVTIWYDGATLLEFLDSGEVLVQDFGLQTAARCRTINRFLPFGLKLRTRNGRWVWYKKGRKLCCFDDGDRVLRTGDVSHWGGR